MAAWTTKEFGGGWNNKKFIPLAGTKCLHSVCFGVGGARGWSVPNCLHQVEDGIVYWQDGVGGSRGFQNVQELIVGSCTPSTGRLRAVVMRQRRSCYWAWLSRGEREGGMYASSGDDEMPVGTKGINSASGTEGAGRAET